MSFLINFKEEKRFTTTMMKEQELENTNTHDFRVCMESNNVPNRGDGIYAAGTMDSDFRPFSLRPQDFVSHHTHECSSVQDFLNAVKFGERRWDESQVESKNLSWVEKETFPSTFVPHGCDIPALSQERMCAIMGRFSHVTLLGDSLTRHVTAGLHIGLKNDFVSGGMVTSDPARKEFCRCDGQFSEHAECRNLDESFFDFRPQQLGLCPKLHNNDTDHQMDLHVADYLDAVDCLLNFDTRPMLLIFQGGLHHSSNALATYNSFLPIWQNDALKTCLKHKKVIVVWCSFNTESPVVDKIFPHQSPENATIFNQQMQDLFDSSGMENITTINWMNFTKGAQTSDGVHYLMNVNFFKAQQLLSLADLMLDEGKFYAG
jgi:hypothetical protein